MRERHLFHSFFATFFYLFVISCLRLQRWSFYGFYIFQLCINIWSKQQMVLLCQYSTSLFCCRVPFLLFCLVFICFSLVLVTSACYIHFGWVGRIYRERLISLTSWNWWYLIKIMGITWFQLNQNFAHIFVSGWEHFANESVLEKPQLWILKDMSFTKCWLEAFMNC